ncbi:MAG: hypothetical protein MK214_02435 [Thalassotalea sp.]|nr:hypothetical protein [Thalassotalea sp.]
MIDLHSHILPGLDDGALDMAETLTLLRIASESGITHMMCTPHIQLGRFDNNLANISNAFEQVTENLESSGIGIKLAFAAEVRICPEIMLLAKQSTLPFIGTWQGKDVLLLELPHSHIPAGTEQLIKWLKNNDIMPMIAHPERNRDILADRKKLQQLTKLDCLFQLTASSICGDFGEDARAIALEMIANEQATIIATDTHNVKRRPPKLKDAKDIVTEQFSEQLAQQLVHDMPWRISADKFSVVS